MTDLDIQPDVIRRGASQARTIGSEVSLARQASNAALAGNAFGVICSPLLLPIYALAKTAADAMMDAGHDALTRSATALDATAADLETIDAGGASTFRAGAR